MRGRHGAVAFPDAVGVGHYRIDLHPSTGGDPYIDLACCPFQLPLGRARARAVENLLAAGKCLGTTHITNGAYRLHPVEWNAGEAAGHLAAFCRERRTTPRAVCAQPGAARALPGRARRGRDRARVAGGDPRAGGLAPGGPDAGILHEPAAG